MSPKILALYVFRAIGGFALAQLLTRKRLRILCYHGFSIGDEYKVAPFMFMKGATFARRMQVLNRRGVRVVSLDEGVRLLKQGAIKKGETVITLDDGWASNLTIGLPILKRYNYPACVYVTTEHLAAGTEVFNVILTYMLQSSNVQTLQLRGIHPGVDGDYSIRTEYDKCVISIIAAVEQHFPFAERPKVLRTIATALNLNIDDVLSNDRFRLMTRAQMAEIYQAGVDIQLHTHTHRLPDRDFESMAYQINENRSAVKAVLGEDKNHFCYPSGMHRAQHPDWLEKLGIASATTCDAGLNPAGTPPMLLKRFLDRDDFSDIEFESEIAGVREIVREMRRWLGHKPKPSPHI